MSAKIFFLFLTLANIQDIQGNKFIVVFKKSNDLRKNVMPAFSAKVDNIVGASMVKNMNFGSFSACVIEADGDAMNTLSQDTGVDFIEENYKVRIADDADICYNYDTISHNRWHLERITQRQKIITPGSGSYPMSSNNRGNGVDIFIVDSGINIYHEDFENRARHAFIASDINEYAGDYSGHGTHVAGIAGGSRYGVAKEANLWSVKVLNGEGEGTVGGIIEGLEYVANKYERERGTNPKFILNLSVGVDGVSKSLDAALRDVTDMGLSVVVAASNDGDSACNYSPARVEPAVTVAASNIRDELTSFSNYGSCVDIFAPGENILSAGIGFEFHTTMNGTSMAAPVVTGVLARVISAVYAKYDAVPSPSQLKQFLLSSSTKGAITNINYTPNKLVYFDCDNIDYSTIEFRTSTTETPWNRVRSTTAIYWGPRRDNGAVVNAAHMGRLQFIVLVYFAMEMI